MSLFPAYEIQAKPRESSSSPELQEINDIKPSTNWLTNSSFQPEILPATRLENVSSDSSECEIVENIIPEAKDYPVISLNSDVEEGYTPRKKKFKKKKHKTEKHKIKVKYELVVDNLYFDDKIRDRGNLRVDTLCSRVRPLYALSQKTLGFIGFKLMNKKEPTKRYYDVKKKIKTKKHDPTIQRTKTKNSEQENENLNELGIDDEKMTREEEKKNRIKEFNEKLAEEPDNIELWLEYVNYDDRDNDFDSLSGRDTGTLKYQRKLAIVEKALEKNPDSKDLFRTKLSLMNELLPADQFSNQVENLLNKDPGNIILWQVLISSTRSSVAMCTAPRILKLYSKCFGTLHMWPRLSTKNYDDCLLEMIYQSLIFLRHAGLWEQMWEALRLNISLNLSIPKNSRDFKAAIDEKKLIDMEEVILTSRLPLNQLWLRVELLRENCHWISVTKEQLELIGDSHRFISANEVTEFIHPMLARNSNFRLAIYCLMALKVPLLPTRHVMMKDFKLGETSWTIDSLEIILPMIFPCVGEMSGYNQRILLSKKLLDGGLTSGPQYLRYHPAQEPYLDFIRHTFKIIAENLPSEEKTQIYIWWLRFERMLVFLQKDLTPKCDKGFKKLKGILKDFLKREENRNNLYFYREYALIERELGRSENCLKILETAIETKKNCPAVLTNFYEKNAILSLYRALIETLFDTRTWEETSESRIFKIFARMSPGDTDTESLRMTEQYLQDCYENFLNDSEAGSLDSSDNKYFLPDFYCDVITCYCYLLYVRHHNVREISKIFEKSIERTSGNPHLQEMFYESQISLFQLDCERSGAKISWLGKYLYDALEKYPDNFYLLSVYAKLESESPNWSVGIRNGNSNRLFSTMSLCLAGRARLESDVCQNDPIARTAALNKLLHFHKRLTSVPEVRSCPLIWRLYMLLLREENLCEKKGEEIYHESVASCPWARCIYIDTAEIAPQHLTQIQDVIREKDLRMHVTPEELDILRG